MRTNTLLLSAGVAAALVAAVFVGAAAANTGAPVFYDARYPAPATSGSEQYEVAEGTDAPPQSSGAVDEPDAGAPPPVTTPDATPHPSTPPSPTPPGDAPRATPQPTPTPTPAPGPDLRPPLAGQPEAPGGPPRSRTPGAPAPSAEQQQAWLAFQQLVRDCMGDAGQEYLAWEWWNPAPDTSNRFPPMPADLTPDQYAVWKLALDGDAGAGADYRWQDAGCWGRAVHVTGGTN